MKRYIQTNPFNIYCFQSVAWEHPVHKHNHFEIIFIKSGQGKHVVNNNTFAYSAGDVFLLGPEDFHYFEIDQVTDFVFIRFMEIFFKDNNNHFSSWEEMVTFLLYAPYQSFGSIVKNDAEQQTLRQLLEVLVTEYNLKHQATYMQMLFSVMKAILTILARNVMEQSSDSQNHQKALKPIENIILYIRKNILRPELLKIENLAEQFDYSPHYLSIYFKKHMGMAIQPYILKHKLTLIENRLKYSTYSISQIAFDFGFTDESHLNKIFKKYYHMPPGEFRSKQNIDNHKFHG